MPDEELPLKEEAEATPPEGSESDDSTELDDLFKETEGQETVSREEFDALKKGVSKFFTEQGMKAKQAAEPKQVAKADPVSHDTDDLSELFFAQMPQAELVQSDLKNLADKLYNGSILKAWKNEKWIQEKAKHLSEEKSKDEENKTRISKPSNDVAFSKNISSVKEEDVAKLTPAQKVQWIQAQVDKERNNTD